MVCGLALSDEDPGARWLRSQILDYVSSDAFQPEIAITETQLLSLLDASVLQTVNDNAALNRNDITM